MSIKDVLQILDKEEEFVFNNEQSFLSLSFDQPNKYELLSVSFSSSFVDFKVLHPDFDIITHSIPIIEYIKWREECGQRIM